MSQGDKILKSAQSLLKKGFFKRPKPEEAYLEFESAAKTFLAEGRQIDAAQAYEAAADVAKSCSKYLVASVYISSAAEIYERNLKQLKENDQNETKNLKNKLLDILRCQSDYLQRAGNFTDAARVMLRASSFAENKEVGQQLLESAIQIFNEENKPASALQSIDTAIEDALSTRDFAVFAKLTYPAFLLHQKLNYGYKSDSLALTLAIVGFFTGDEVLIEQALGKFDSYSSDQFIIAEMLQKAFKERNEEILAEAKAHDGKIGLSQRAAQLLNQLKIAKNENSAGVEDEADDIL